jgi:hypothetical protein
VTALSFDLDPVDTAVTTLLRSPGNLNVHVGNVTDSDGDAKTISAPLPYVLYSSSLPFGPLARLGGSQPDVTSFTVSYVHSTLEGCKAVALAVRRLLDGAELSVAGKPARIRLSADDRHGGVSVGRDQVWTRPGGLPLFYAMDRWNVL